MPKISVIVPVYNAEKYVDRCLNSLRDQSLPDLEIICVNDSSSDDSGAIIRSHQSKDNRIKVIDLPARLGAGHARNIGMENASGEFLGFVDADDFIDFRMYQSLYESAKEENCDIAKGVIFGFDNETQKIFLRDWYEINYLIEQDKSWFCYGFTSAIFKKKLFWKVI